MERPKRKRNAVKEAGGTFLTNELLMLVKIKFTSLKAPKIDVTLTAPPSQTFHALKTRLAEETKLNPLALRFLFKNKAISDSKSVQEVFGQVEEAQITVMVMKGVSSSQSSTSNASQEGEKMVTDDDEFWTGIREVVMGKYKGPHGKEEVFGALKKGFDESFG
jgi:hypothetical protein